MNMANKIGIYDLNNLAFLESDFADIFKRIEILYDATFLNGEVVFESMISVGIKHHWTAEECRKEFNAIIATVKCLTKDMYSIVEAVIRNDTKQFEISILEAKYLHFKEFRLLNNKFKHFNDTSVEITLTSIAICGVLELI